MNTIRKFWMAVALMLAATVAVAAAYGESEELIGDALAKLGIRGRMFLATKFTVDESGTSTRSGEESFARSLQRLRTDHVDLLQVVDLEQIDVIGPQTL